MRFGCMGARLCSALRLDPVSGRQRWRLTKPAAPSGWVEDFHLRAIEHARRTTKPLGGKRSELGLRRLLSERIAVSKPNRQTGDPVMAQMTALRRRMIDDMTLRNLSPATQQSYVYAVAKFSRFFGRSPDQLGVEEVRAYQIHLAGRGLSWPHLNQVSCALRFFFGVTLGRKDVVDRIVSAKKPTKLPIVLSSEEVVRFLQAVPGLRSRAALTTAYSAGLRVCEVAT